MQKWEYLIESIGWENRPQRLNKLGEQGWELILLDGTTYYFKRPLK